MAWHFQGECKRERDAAARSIRPLQRIEFTRIRRNWTRRGFTLAERELGRREAVLAFLHYRTFWSGNRIPPSDQIPGKNFF
jgi:hypothetical protein